MTVRDIQHHLASTLSVELSVGTISRITDAVAEAVLEWQRRPLEEFYPVVYLDAIRVKVRVNHRVASRSAHIAVGVDMDGIKHVLGIWAPGPRREPPSRAARVRSCWHNRSVGACLIVEGAPPARERSARGNVTGSPAFPRRTQAVLAPGHGPDLCGPPGSAPLDAVRLLRGPPEGRGRSQGRSAPPRTRRPPGRL